MIMEKEICKSRKNNICMGVHVEQYDNVEVYLAMW